MARRDGFCAGRPSSPTACTAPKPRGHRHRHARTTAARTIALRLDLGKGALCAGATVLLKCKVMIPETCTFAMIQDHPILNLLKTVRGGVRWVGHGRKPLETCLMRLGWGAGSVKTENRFHSNRRRHESSQARLDQAHAPPTTPRRTKATSPMTLRLQRGGKRGREGCG